MLSCRAIDQRVLQKAVLLSLDRNRELSLLISNHTSFASRCLNPSGKRDLARPHESHGLGMNRVSVTRSWGETEGHFPGISQRTASPGSVQIHVEGPNGAAVCHSVFTSADVSKSYIRGWSARAYRDGHGRNTHVDELRHIAIRLLHVHSFPTIPGRRNPPRIEQERRYCVANA